MTRSTDLLLFLQVVVYSFVIGGMIPLLVPRIAVDFSNIFVGGLNGSLIGASCMIVEISFLSNRSIRWLRRLPIAVIILMRAFAYSICIVCGLTLPALLVLGEALWLESNFALSFWMSISIAFGISTLIELLQLLGKEAAISILTGRYRRPRAEDRIVMFADLAGSTALAERLGDLKFHELLGDVAYDLDKPIAASGGETHRYVGEAIIVTWSMEKPANFARSVACAHAIIDTLARTSDDFVARYGQPMRMRIALHCGPVAAGEVGGWKKEIALLGDTMNSTARIEGAARDFGADIVISDAIKTHLPEEWAGKLDRLPDYEAHGKQDALRLWTVRPDA